MVCGEERADPWFWCEGGIGCDIANWPTELKEITEIRIGVIAKPGAPFGDVEG